MILQSVNLSIVIEYFKKKNINITIDKFTDCNIILNLLTDTEKFQYDIIFLDVVMQHNGIYVSSEIIKKYPNSNIIFTTSSKEFAVDAFKVYAFDYLLKPLNKEELFNSLDRLSKKLNFKKKTWSVKTKDLSLSTINIEDIIYIESINRRLDIHLNDNQIITSTALRTKFIESIPFNLKENSFLICHNSYIVNMNKIKGIKDLEFIMEDNELVPISKRMLKEVKDEYINYLVGDVNEVH